MRSASNASAKSPSTGGIGSQDQGAASVHIEVVPGVGTGGLENLRGEADRSITEHGYDGHGLVLSCDIG